MLPRDVGNLRMTLDLIRSEECGLTNLQGDHGKNQAALGTCVRGWWIFSCSGASPAVTLAPLHSNMLSPGREWSLPEITHSPERAQERVWGMVFALPVKAGKGVRHIVCGFNLRS